MKCCAPTPSGELTGQGQFRLMQPIAQRRRAFTLVEMVVVLAIMGIALAVVAPAMILTARPTGLENVLSDARRAALRRSEPVTLLVSRKGTWEIDEAKSGLAILSGAGMPAVANDLRIDVSALGLCTPGRGASPFTVALDPFTCSFASP